MEKLFQNIKILSWSFLINAILTEELKEVIKQKKFFNTEILLYLVLMFLLPHVTDSLLDGAFSEGPE